MTNVWTPGMARIPGSGRAKGTPNRQTTLKRAAIKNAIETLRTGEGKDPIAAAFKIAQFLEDMAASCHNLPAGGIDVSRRGTTGVNRPRLSMKQVQAFEAVVVGTYEPGNDAKALT